jgi:hypothetical protein
MTWSLKLRNGDLERSSNQLAKATNETKLVQDLRIQFLTKMGIDDLHPEFGSLLDGGTTPDGIVHDTFIGTDDKENAKLLIQSELHRIINDYQQKQLTRAKRDKMVYGKATLTPREFVLSVRSINVVEYLDAFNITIELTTASKETQILELLVNTK